MVEALVVAIILAVLYVVVSYSPRSGADHALDQTAHATGLRIIQVETTLLQRDGRFSSAPATLTAANPLVKATIGASTADDVAAVATSADGLSAGVAVRSFTGTCWYAHVRIDGPSLFGRGNDTCRADTALNDLPTWPRGDAAEGDRWTRPIQEP